MGRVAHCIQTLRGPDSCPVCIGFKCRGKKTIKNCLLAGPEAARRAHKILQGKRRVLLGWKSKSVLSPPSPQSTRLFLHRAADVTDDVANGSYAIALLAGYELSPDHPILPLQAENEEQSLCHCPDPKKT